MNYRHAFHAGNFADVVKHAILVALLRRLAEKESAFTYFETHAGSGHYDLRGNEAQRTGESSGGVARVLAALPVPETLRDYVDVLTLLGTTNPPRTYPGSPLIASRILRPGDRGILCELEPTAAATLRKLFAGDRRFAVHERDGWEALRALLPPTPRRGLVLIDPPYEAQLAEFGQVVAGLAEVRLRFPEATCAIWYPIKLARDVMPFHRKLAAVPSPRGCLVAELLLHKPDSGLRLNGCGVAIIDPPWRLERQLEELLPALAGVLVDDPAGGVRLEWLRQR
ncbi:MAG: 23S rRNA (adenine(2030)-N(6))-methyltransferase RlmJ [Lysobacterales bacterium]